MIARRFSMFVFPPISRWALLLVLTLGVSAGGASFLRADEFAGRWRGRWTTESPGPHYGHHGTLRMNLRPTGDGSYQGTFAGRFAVVVPYFYRAPVYRTEMGLVSSKRLGPLGNFEMRLQTNENGDLSGGWSAAGEFGGIRLRQ